LRLDVLPNVYLLNGFLYKQNFGPQFLILVSKLQRNYNPFEPAGPTPSEPYNEPCHKCVSLILGYTVWSQSRATDTETVLTVSETYNKIISVENDHHIRW